MAVRKRLAHDQKTREKIQTSQLINRLTSHVLGEVDLSSSQVTAALGLIRKTLPDLQATEYSGEIEGNLTHNLIQVEYIGSDKDTDS
jgi:hypothetical protein